MLDCVSKRLEWTSGLLSSSFASLPFSRLYQHLAHPTPWLPVITTRVISSSNLIISINLVAQVLGVFAGWDRQRDGAEGGLVPHRVAQPKHLPLRGKPQPHSPIPHTYSRSQIEPGFEHDTIRAGAQWDVVDTRCHSLVQRKKGGRELWTYVRDSDSFLQLGDWQWTIFQAKMSPSRSHPRRAYRRSSKSEEVRLMRDGHSSFAELPPQGTSPAVHFHQRNITCCSMSSSVQIGLAVSNNLKGELWPFPPPPSQSLTKLPLGGSAREFLHQDSSPAGAISPPVSPRRSSGSPIASPRVTGLRERALSSGGLISPREGALQIPAPASPPPLNLEMTESQSESIFVGLVPKAHAAPMGIESPRASAAGRFA
jgi:hypothetical protein